MSSNMNILDNKNIKVELSASDITNLLRREVESQGYELVLACFKCENSRDYNDNSFFSPRKKSSSHFKNIEITIREKSPDVNKEDDSIG